MKVCTYFPYPMKLWCNGHEWVKRQLDAGGIGYQSLANGFAACQDPAGLQQLADRLGHQQVLALFARLLAVIPLPLTDADRTAGYDWELSMNQVEYSRTLVVDRPLAARAFFEVVIAENVGLGRPSEVSLVFDRRVQRNTPGRFRTRVVTEGVEPTLSITYKSSRVKQYLKQGRAIRIETVINQPNDIGVQRRVAHLEELGAIAKGVNRRILDVQRVATGPDLSASLFEQVALPYGCDGQRTVALRYGDPRVMALLAALTLSLHHIAGFTNASLRPLVATLLGGHYRTSQMGYDLWRLRTNGLIRRFRWSVLLAPGVPVLRVAERRNISLGYEKPGPTVHLARVPAGRPTAHGSAGNHALLDEVAVRLPKVHRSLTVRWVVDRMLGRDRRSIGSARQGCSGSSRMPAAATVHDDVVALDVGALLDPDRLDAITEYRIAFRVGMMTLTSTAGSATQGGISAHGAIDTAPASRAGRRLQLVSRRAPGDDPSTARRPSW